MIESPVTEPLPPLALLAGGQATRLLPITATIPKSMVEVAGEPFIAHQLRLLVREDITDVVICSGHLGEQIENFVRDGTQLGCRVCYSTDGGRPRGTGGALRHALPLLGRSFMVMYGDSYLNTRFRPVYQAFRRSSLPAMMVVLRNEGRWDASNVEFVDGVVRRHDKVDRTPSMTYIDYGLAVFDSTVLLSRPPDETFDLSDLNRDLAARKLLAGYEVHERFYEIGSPAGLAETDAFLRRALQRPAD